MSKKWWEGVQRKTSSIKEKKFRKSKWWDRECRKKPKEVEKDYKKWRKIQRSIYT